MTTIIAMLTILFLSFVQNISFSIVSRSRNRNNMKYHLIAAFFSNTIWFITFRQLVKADMTFLFFVPYCLGTMLGSVFGVKISMWIESKLGAAADGHLVTKKDSGLTTEDMVAYFDYIDYPTVLLLSGNSIEPQTRHLKLREWLEAGKPKSGVHDDNL